jgi:hypothetical protein
VGRRGSWPPTDTPQPIDEAVINEEMVQAMKAGGIRPSLIHAWSKTRLLLTEQNRHLIAAEDLAKWQMPIVRLLSVNSRVKFRLALERVP